MSNWKKATPRKRPRRIAKKIDRRAGALHHRDSFAAHICRLIDAMVGAADAIGIAAANAVNRGAEVGIIDLENIPPIPHVPTIKVYGL